jgi:beta-glucosidase
MFYVGYPISWDWLAEGIKVGQDYAVNNTRLGIPAIVQTEGIHGFLIGNATIFNSPIAQACSFNRELQRQMGEQIAIEAAALGVTQLFAPLADLARELRYGRVEETYGEDGYLAGEMAYNYIVGCQGQNVSAMVKHFAAYSEPEGGLNTAPVHGGERELRTTWLPPFHRAIIDGGAYAVMSAYHAYDGIPAVADYHMLTEILRNEWGMWRLLWISGYWFTDFCAGYKYFVSSDAGATDRLFKNFLTCGVNDFGCVTEQCLTAGNDVEVSDIPSFSLTDLD